MKKTQIYAYTDGASRGNPGRGGYGAIVVYPDSKGYMKVDELGGFEKLTTNNRMELSAVLGAITHFNDYYDLSAVEGLVGVGQKLILNIYTDSSYVIKGINEWIHGWKRNNWITSTKEPVKNEDLWRALDSAINTLYRVSISCKWVLLPGHAGVAGNEKADQIATGFADQGEKFEETLYRGGVDQYIDQSILIPPSTTEIQEAKKNKAKSRSKSSSGQAYSYVSYVAGKLQIHPTWAECEKVVKGKSGAKFKKATSPEDEELIKKEFTKK